MRCQKRIVQSILMVGLVALLGSPLAQARDGAKPRAMAPAKPAGPAKKMKILNFVTLMNYGILKLQFQDRNGKATKAPAGGEITYRTNVTKPRKGKLPMTLAKWKAGDKVYVFTKVAPRQRYVCPPRTYWIRVHFKAGRKRFSAYFKKKFACI